jgi:hypothetical protein|tara:strand:- start:153 stop:416 length:264 start_codon:yes stop_codon:yes gene_type:complete
MLLVEPFAVMAENVTSDPFDMTKTGEPESMSNIELLKTEPLSEPGWFGPMVELVGLLLDVASEIDHESVPHESPDVPPLPSTKLTAR